MAPMLLRGLKSSISCASPASLATCSTVDYRRPAPPGSRHGRRSYERSSTPAPAPHLKDAHRSKSLNAMSLFSHSKPHPKSHGKLRKPPPPPPPPLASPGSSSRCLLTGVGDGEGDDGYSFFDSLEGYLESDPIPSLIPAINSSRFRTVDRADELSASFSTPALRPSVWPRPRDERRLAFRSASASASSSSTSSSNSDITIGGASAAGRNAGGGADGTWVRFQTVNSGEESAVLQPSSFRKSSASAREELVDCRSGSPSGELLARFPSVSGSSTGKQLVCLTNDSGGTQPSTSAVSLERFHVDKEDGGDARAALKLSASDRAGSGDQVVILRVSLHCKGCEAKVRKHISKMQGVKSFSIEFAAKKVTVVGDVTPLGVLSSISKVKNAQFWAPPPPRTI